MILFLTSSPSGPLDKPNDEHILDNSNHFVDNLRNYYKENMRGLMISAFPDSYDQNDEMTSFFADCFYNANMPIDFTLWDYRSNDINIHEYDLIILAGGHVPTQNNYFKNIKLKEKLIGYSGVVIGISAGTMNCASVVYAQPELEGESVNPNYQRFIEGLNLTNINVLPHYQMVKDYYLDGRRLFEDITYQDSYGKEFIALVDGSYIVQENNRIKIYGEAYKISNAQLTKISNLNEIIIYK